MKQPIINCTLEEVVKAVTEQVLAHLAPLPNQQKDPQCEDVLSRRQVKDLLSISYATLHNYVKAGILEPVRVPGIGKVFFNRCAVYKLLNTGRKGGQHGK